MRALLLFSTILFLSFNKADTFDKCMLNLTAEELQAEKIELYCGNFNDSYAFNIKDFSIKFPGKPTSVVKGTKLDSQTKAYVKDLKPNHVVTIFDIREAYEDGKLIGKDNIPAFHIKIVE